MPDIDLPKPWKAVMILKMIGLTWYINLFIAAFGFLTKILRMNILTRLRLIKVFVFDMDGVLTDGTLLIET